MQWQKLFRQFSNYLCFILKISRRSSLCIFLWSVKIRFLFLWCLVFFCHLTSFSKTISFEFFISCINCPLLSGNKFLEKNSPCISGATSNLNECICSEIGKFVVALISLPIISFFIVRASTTCAGIFLPWLVQQIQIYVDVQLLPFRTSEPVTLISCVIYCLWEQCWQVDIASIPGASCNRRTEKTQSHIQIQTYKRKISESVFHFHSCLAKNKWELGEVVIDICETPIALGIDISK